MTCTQTVQELVANIIGKDMMMESLEFVKSIESFAFQMLLNFQVS